MHMKMLLKALPMAIFAFLLTEFCIVEAAPKKCQKPKFVEPLDLMKLDGSVWYIQHILNGGKRFHLVCASGTFSTGMDNRTVFLSAIYMFEKTGLLNSDLYEIQQSTSDNFVMKFLKKKSIELHGYTIKHDENMLINSMCFYHNGTFMLQDYLIWTKERIVNRKTLDDAVNKFEIEVEDIYVVYQDKSCFKYKGEKH